MGRGTQVVVSSIFEAFLGRHSRFERTATLTFSMSAQKQPHKARNCENMECRPVLFTCNAVEPSRAIRACTHTMMVSGSRLFTRTSGPPMLCMTAAQCRKGHKKEARTKYYCKINENDGLIRGFGGWDEQKWPGERNRRFEADVESS